MASLFIETGKQEGDLGRLPPITSNNLSESLHKGFETRTIVVRPPRGE